MKIGGMHLFSLLLQQEHILNYLHVNQNQSRLTKSTTTTIFFWKQVLKDVLPLCFWWNVFGLDYLVYILCSLIVREPLLKIFLFLIA